VERTCVRAPFGATMRRHSGKAVENGFARLRICQCGEQTKQSLLVMHVVLCKYGRMAVLN
jgi:hypothetical protein